MTTSTTSDLIIAAPVGSSATIQSIYGYAADVLTGRVTACKKVKLACERFFRDLAASERDDYPWRFDPERAERPIAMIEKYFVPPKGEYDTMRLMPWQKFCEGNIYGWVSKATGLRRYQEALIVVGRGNGKSTMVAGNAAYGICKDGEHGPDVYLLANSKEQAAIVYDTVSTQLKESRISSRFKVTRSYIGYSASNGKIQHRASDSRKLDGLNPSMAIFDEIHGFKDYKLINVIKRGMNKRRQPIALYITTMGTVLDGPLMDFYGLFSDAMVPGLLNDSVADRMFAYICELDAEDDVNDSSNWIKANPSLGVLLDLDQLKTDWERCKHVPQERSDFICKQLNIFTNNEDAKFVDFDVLKRNDGTFDESALLGRDCYGGFDLSMTEDFTSASLLFPLEDKKLFWLNHTWTPRRKAEEDHEKIPYYEWAMAGYLTLVDDDYVHYEDVYEWFVRAAEKYVIHSIGYDPANARMLVVQLEAKGLPVHMVRQGSLTLNAPMKDLRERLLDGKLVHNNNPMCRWYLNNVKIRQNNKLDKDKENWTPTKASKYQKIDGFASLLDAHTELMRLGGERLATGEAEVRVINLLEDFEPAPRGGLANMELSLGW